MALLRINDTKLEYWNERDRLHIALQWKSTEETIAEWWDDDARQMFDDGFFSEKGHILGRLVNDSALHASVYQYLLHHNMIPEDPTFECEDCGTRLTCKEPPKSGAKCVDCVLEWKKNEPNALAKNEWYAMLRSSRRFQEA